MTDVSKEAVDALSARLRGQDAIPNRTEVADHVDALRAALDEAEARAERLEAALVEHNDLLRSTFQIAEREGVKGMIASTNWDAFYNRVVVVLKRHHQTANEARAAHLGAKP